MSSSAADCTTGDSDRPWRRLGLSRRQGRKLVIERKPEPDRSPPFEDRRRSRLASVLQVGAVVVFVVLALQLLVPAGRRGRHLQASWLRTTISGHSRCARRGACSSIATSRCSSTTVHSLTSRSIARRTKDPRGDHPAAGRGGRSRPGADAADGRAAQREPSYRPIPTHRGCHRDAGLARSRPGAWNCRECWSERAGAEVSGRWLAAHLFGYVGAGQRTAGDAGDSAGVHRRQVRRRARLQPAADGRGRRPPCARQQRRPRGRGDPRSERCRPRGTRVQLTIDYDLQKAAEDGFRHAGFNGAALIMDPRNGEVLTYASLPAYDPNDFAGGIDSATWAALNTDKLRPVGQPGDPGALFTRVDLQDRRRHGGARRRPRHARLSRATARAARTSTAATTSAI